MGGSPPLGPGQQPGRRDVTPEALAFGQIKRGTSPAANINVSFLGNGQWQILEARCESNYVKTALKELRRDEGEVAYEVIGPLRPDTPVGKWYTDIWLKTNNPATPRVRVPLTVDIESALSITPGTVALGQVKAGTQAERKVIIRGVEPFRITDIKGIDKLVTVRDSTEDSKPVHVLTVTVNTPKAGEFNRTIDLDRTIRVITDLAQEGQIEFQARGKVVP